MTALFDKAKAMLPFLNDYNDSSHILMIRYFTEIGWICEPLVEWMRIM